MELQEAYKKIVTSCIKKEICKYEVIQKLQNWKINSNEIEGVLTNLEQENFINEERYAKSFARDRFRFHQWGKIKISYYLKGKGIPQSFIDMALEEIPNNEYLIMIRNVFEKKLGLTNEKDSEKMKSKIWSFLKRRGYEDEVIGKMINEI